MSSKWQLCSPLVLNAWGSQKAAQFRQRHRCALRRWRAARATRSESTAAARWPLHSAPSPVGGASITWLACRDYGAGVSHQADTAGVALPTSQQLDQRRYQSHQLVLDRIWIGVDPGAARRRAREIPGRCAGLGFQSGGEGNRRW